VEVFVVAEREPVRRRLDARPFERAALDDIDTDVELPERGLDAREVDLAVALRGMRVARPQQRALDEHRQIKARPRRQFAQIQIAAVTPRRDGAVASWLGARDAEDSGKRPQRNENAGQELGDLVVPIEVDVTESSFRKLLRKLAGNAGI